MKRPWIAPLIIVTVAFLAFTLPPYLSLDPAGSRLPLDPSLPWHYPALVSHIAFGTVALLICCVQVWPWFRQRYPHIHRRLGRTYVFAGVLPAAVTGVAVSVAAVTPGFAGKAGNLTLIAVWLATTFAGFLAARRRDYARHRRWMIRSFALTTSIVVNRLWTLGLIVGLLPFRDSHFAGDTDALIKAASEAGIWLSWVVNLFIAEWWIERKRTPRRAGQVAGPSRADNLGAA